MIIVIGEILMDIFPGYERLGGAPFNFAYHLERLGAPVCFVSRVGDDPAGRDILKCLDQRGFDTRHIQIDPDYPTGRVEVIPDDSGGHDFHIVEDVAYDRIELPDHPAELSGGDPVELIYFGTLAQRTPVAMNRFQRFLKNKNDNTIAFYDVNLRKNAYTREIIHASLRHADFLKLNHDELVLLGEMFAPEVDCEGLAGWFMAHYHIKDTAVTRGSSGSELITPEGRYASGAAEIGRLKDTVGAGDAYAAMLVIGHLNGWSPQRMLDTASRFAADVCTISGAVPSEVSFYDPYRQLIGRESNAER